MPGRKNPKATDDQALAEYRMLQQTERGEKVVGEDAEWLDRRGTAANAGRRADAESRHSHTRR